ncbi:MAG: transporter ATP-binding protein [Frondihabitans sp.]|nr:transporter ATP-binding protein [Frondihabitans sp.]
MTISDFRTKGIEMDDAPDAGPSQALVSVQRLRKSFGDDVVLDEVSCEFREREITVIIGRSGSGKSTLLRVLAGLTEADGGTVRSSGTAVIEGGEPTDAWGDYQHQVGMIFQNYTLWPHMSVLDNLALAPRKVLKEKPAQIEKRALEALAEVGMADYLHRWPSSLSGGQRQRVAIARALMMKPKLLLCDEITSALDPPVAAEVLSVLARLKTEENISVALVTHDMAFAARAADRVLFFENGRIAVDSTPEDAFEHSTNAELRSFVDAVRW